MSLSHLRTQLAGLDLAIETLKNKRNSLISQIKLKEKPSGKIIRKSNDPNHEKNLKLLRLGISISKKPNKEMEKVGSGLSKEDLGRQGEISFWNYLHEVLDMNVCKITWVNKIIESKKPYDFEIEICGNSYFIDVKCTRSQYKQPIYISSAERIFADQHKSNYFVARLYQWESPDDKKYKADTFNVKLLTIEQAVKAFKIK